MADTRTDPTTYVHTGGIGKTGQDLQAFGDRQNGLNQLLLQQTASLQAENHALSAQLALAMRQNELLEARIAELEKALDTAKNETQSRLARMQEDVKAAVAEVDRLRLTTKLNSNAIDRLSRKGD